MKNKNVDYIKKTLIVFSAAMVLFPIFFIAATNVSFAQEMTKAKVTQDSSLGLQKENDAIASVESTESAESTKSVDSTTVSENVDSASSQSDQIKDKIQTTVESSETVKEKSTDTTHNKVEDQSTLSKEVLEQLKKALPNAEIIYQEDKLIISLPSGEKPDYAKQVVKELNIQVPVEIKAKLAEQNEKSNAYKIGYQFFNDDMGAQADKNIDIIIQKIYTGNLPLVAKLMDKSKIETIADVQDIIDSIKNAYNRVQNPRPLGVDGVYLEKSTQKYVFYFVGINLSSNYQKIDSVWGEDFRNGYLAAMIDFKNELNTFLQHIISQAKIDQDLVANNAAYKPPTTDSSGFGGNLANLIKALQELWSNYTQAPLDQNGTTVFIYTPSPGVQSTTRDAVSKTVRSLLVMIGLIIPTVQNKLIKQVLEDPRAIGGQEGVFLDDNNTLAGALEIGGSSLSDILKFMGFSNAIDSTVANTIYLGIRDPIKSALVNTALNGETNSIKNLLSGTKLSSGGKTLNGTYRKGETLALAKDVGFDLTTKYIKELRNIAIKDAIKNQKMSNVDFFKYVNVNVNEFREEANGKNRIMSEGGQAAREVFYTIYQAEYDAIAKAIADYKNDPAVDPTNLTDDQKFYFTIPSSGAKVEVVDYQIVRKWLFKAGLAAVKEGMIAADVKSHQQMDGNIEKLTQTPADKILAVADKQDFDQNTLYDWSATHPYTNNALTPLRPTLVNIVKDAYLYGYNSEVDKANESFKAGGISFTTQSNTMTSPPFSMAGPMGIDSINDFIVAEFKYNQNSDKTGRILNGLSTVEFLKATIDDKEIQLSGLAYLDGIKKMAKEKTVNIRFSVAGVKGQEQEFQAAYDAAEIKDMMETVWGPFPTPLQWNRFANLDNKEFSIDYPSIPGWEVAIKGSDKKFKVALNDETVINNPDGEFNPYKGIPGDSGYYKLIKVLKEQPTVYYSKVITPVIETLNLTGSDTKGYVVSGSTSTHERTTINFKSTSKGNTVAQVDTDDSGQFSFHLTKDQVGTSGSKKQVFADATYINEYGTKTISSEKKAELLSSTVVHMGFNADFTLKVLHKSVSALGFLPMIDFYNKVDSQGEGNEIKFYIRNPKKAVKIGFNAKEGYTGVNIPLIGANGPLIDEGENELLIEAYAKINGQEILVSTEPLVIKITYIKESLGFNVTTKDGANTLKWTNRIISLPGTIFNRDNGNILEIKVKDKRLAAKQNKWSLYATTTTVNNMELTFNDRKLSNVSTLIMSGEDDENQKEMSDHTIITTKSFAEDEGILLTSEAGIAIGDYSSQKNTAPTVNWSLTDTYTAK